MRKFSTLIHLKDDSQYLEQTLDSLRVSDELLVIDHLATAETRGLLHKSGVSVVDAIDGVHDGAYATNASHDWVLIVRPSESLDSELRRALERWKHEGNDSDREIAGYLIAVDSQALEGRSNDHRELRFVNRTRINWMEELPGSASNVLSLPGSLLRVA